MRNPRRTAISKDPDQRRVLFTGTSGIALHRALESVVAHAQEELGRRVKIVSAEESLLDLVGESGVLLPFAPIDRHRRLMHALSLPKELLRKSWRESFGRASEASRDETSDVFMSVHACHYHVKSREYLSLVDQEMVASWMPTSVVTLIDDVEDVFGRLSSPGHLFSRDFYDYSGFNGIVALLQNLSTALHWRKIDLAFAESLAKHCNCEHLLVAVKHPAETLSRSIFCSGLRRVYLSHPISEPRRQLKSGDQAGYEEFLSEFDEVARALRKEAVLFEPTSIDEFRFESVKARRRDGSEVFLSLPRLSERWPPLVDPRYSMWTQPEGLRVSDVLASAVPEDAIDDFRRTKEARGAEATKRAIVEVEIAQRLIEGLIGEIEDQVATRDFKLVDQSQDLFVFRPLYRGNASTGVQREIEHHALLSAGLASSKRGAVWIFSPDSDEKDWRKRQAITQVILGGFVENKGRAQMEQCFGTVDFLGSEVEVTLRMQQALVGAELLTHRRKKTLEGSPAGVQIGEEQKLAGALSRAFVHPFRWAIERVTESTGRPVELRQSGRGSMSAVALVREAAKAWAAAARI